MSTRPIWAKEKAYSAWACLGEYDGCGGGGGGGDAGQGAVHLPHMLVPGRYCPPHHPMHF